MTPSKELIQPCLGAPEVERGVNTNGSFQPSVKNVRNDSGRQLSELASPNMDSSATSSGERMTMSSGIVASVVLSTVTGASTASSTGAVVGTSTPRLPSVSVAFSCEITTDGNVRRNTIAINAICRKLTACAVLRDSITLAPPPAGVGRFHSSLIEATFFSLSAERWLNTPTKFRKIYARNNQFI